MMKKEDLIKGIEATKKYVELSIRCQETASKQTSQTYQIKELECTLQNILDNLDNLLTQKQFHKYDYIGTYLEE